MKRFLLGISVTALLAACGFLTHGRWESWLESMRIAGAEPVPVLTVLARPYQVEIPASGELTGLQTAPIPTPAVRTGSLRVGWLAEEGRIVRQGEIVARFDDTAARLSLQQSETQLESVRHRIHRTEAEGDGQLRLLEMDRYGAERELAFALEQVRHDETIFSRWEIQESIVSAALAEFRREGVDAKRALQQRATDSDLGILSVDRNQAESEIELIAETLSSLLMRSPAQGVLLYRRMGFDGLQVGQEVWPGQTILEVAGLDQFRAVLRIAEKRIQGVQPGVAASVRLAAFPAVELTGTVDRVDRVARQIDRRDPMKYFECHVVLDIPPDLMELLKPGMALEGSIVVESFLEAHVLPISAVFRGDSGHYVFARSGEEFEKEFVKVIASDHAFHVVEGLSDGIEVALKHPFEERGLILPDFTAPPSAPQQRRFIIFN